MLGKETTPNKFLQNSGLCPSCASVVRLKLSFDWIFFRSDKLKQLNKCKFGCSGKKKH